MKTLAVEWVFEGFAGDVLYWRCGRCEQDFVAPGDPRQFVVLSDHEPRCWCGAEPEIVLHGLGKTGWVPRVPSWVPGGEASSAPITYGRVMRFY